MTTLFKIQWENEEVEITLENFHDWFEGECDEKELAGRHFSGSCTWDFDLTDNHLVPEASRGMYYLHGNADGDWGTTFSSFTFESNAEIEEARLKAPRVITISIKGDMAENYINQLEVLAYELKSEVLDEEDTVISVERSDQ